MAEDIIAFVTGSLHDNYKRAERRAIGWLCNQTHPKIQDTFTPTYTRSQILAYARSITCVVPGWVTGDLDHAIKLRKESQLFWADQDPGHQKYIDTLHEVRTILTPLVVKQVNKHKRKHANKDLPAYENFYAGLDIEELEDCPDTDIQPHRSSTHVDTNAPRKPMKATAKDEKFELYCLLKFFREVRNEFSKLLEGVQRGQPTLNIACQLFYYIVELMLKRNEKFVEENPQFSSHDAVCGFLNVPTRFASGDSQVFSFGTNIDMPAPDKEHAELLCLSGSHTLHILYDRIASDGKSGRPDELPTLAAKRLYDQWYLLTRNKTTADNPVLKHVKKSIGKQFPLWLPSAFEMYAEIYDMFDNRGSTILHALTASAQALVRYTRFAEHIGMSDTESEYDAAVQDIGHIIGYVLHLDQSEKWAHVDVVTSMLQLQAIKKARTSFALAHASEGSALLSMAHLFAALRSHGLVTSASWHDMHLFLSKHASAPSAGNTYGQSYFLGYGSNHPIRSIYTCFLRGIGYSADQAKTPLKSHPLMLFSDINTTRQAIPITHTSLHDHQMRAQLQIDRERGINDDPRASMWRAIEGYFRSEKTLTAKRFIKELSQATVLEDREISFDYSNLSALCHRLGSEKFTIRKVIELFHLAATKNSLFPLQQAWNHEIRPLLNMREGTLGGSSLMALMAYHFLDLDFADAPEDPRIERANRAMEIAKEHDLDVYRLNHIVVVRDPGSLQTIHANMEEAESSRLSRE
ncbi:hypothetical protein KCU92_g10163, partial [Aureobasidium melanogenum]|jgi:hypothetical protein